MDRAIQPPCARKGSGKLHTAFWMVESEKPSSFVTSRSATSATTNKLIDPDMALVIDAINSLPDAGSTFGEGGHHHDRQGEDPKPMAYTSTLSRRTRSSPMLAWACAWMNGNVSNRPADEGKGLAMVEQEYRPN